MQMPLPALIKPDTRRARAPTPLDVIAGGVVGAGGMDARAAWRVRSPRAWLVASTAESGTGPGVAAGTGLVLTFRVAGLSQALAGIVWDCAERAGGRACLVCAGGAADQGAAGSERGPDDVWLELAYSVAALRTAVAENLCLSAPGALRRLHVLLRKEAVRADVSLARLFQPRCVQRGCCGVPVARPSLHSDTFAARPGTSGAGAVLEAAAP